MNSVDPALMWLAALAGGGLVGWAAIVVISRWLDKQDSNGSGSSHLPTFPPSGMPSRTGTRSSKPPQDEWPDTVMVASGEGASAAEGAATPDTAPTGPRPLPARVEQVAVSPLLEGLSDLAQGHFDSAWGHLREVPLSDPEIHTLLNPMERLAAAFEGAKRFELARAVYERMADIDPNYRDLKPRLVRARGLAQSMMTHPPVMQVVNAEPGANLPSHIGRYLIEREIGRGAMGAIYLAHDPNLAAPVALKTLALSKEFEGPDLADARARFLREAEMAGRLQHPDIVHIFNVGESEGLAFIAMELLSGSDLSNHTVTGHLLPVRTVLEVVARAADALAYAHTRGVMHRDIKPANIMVDLERNAVKIMDFGIARVADSTRTRTGVVMGTPSFMSPEQLSGLRIDGRTDLYSLGVTLYQLLTGHLPFVNQSMALLMRAIANDPAPDIRTLRPQLPEALANIVALALEKRPEIRYADGTQMAHDLRAVAASWHDDQTDSSSGGSSVSSDNAALSSTLTT
jgi:tRNA A-37 threonylcarbamoyl transferase component Bud32